MADLEPQLPDSDLHGPIQGSSTVPSSIVLSLDLPTKSLWYPSASQDFLFRCTATDQSTFFSVLQKDKLPLEDEIDVKSSESSLSVRAVISHSSRKKFVSASIRYIGKDKGPLHREFPPIAFSKVISTSPPDKEFLISQDGAGDYLLEKFGIIEGKKISGKLVFPKYEYKQDKTIPLDFSVNHVTGLIVIAGGTGTGKSFFAKGIVLRYLVRLAIERWSLSCLRANKKKEDTERSLELAKFDPPHLVTFEDPIERWELFIDNFPHQLDENEVADINAGFRLTARAKKYDVDSIELACLHSLRQKPSLIYIGECREPEEWRQAIELGNTGHLVVTTCHASTLVDTFVKLSGRESNDAQSRQRLASSLAGVIHLRQGDFSTFHNCDEKFKSTESPVLKPWQNLMHIWRRTEESVSNFVVDGMSSLVNDEQNVISRSRSTIEILDWQWDNMGIEWPDIEERKLWKRNSHRAAFQLDLKGL